MELIREVLVSYDFTLLSNIGVILGMYIGVLVSYDFTLLSNKCVSLAAIQSVLVSYDFTLLSNLKFKNKYFTVLKTA